MQKSTTMKTKRMLPMAILFIVVNCGCSLPRTPASIGGPYYFIGICGDKNADTRAFTDSRVLRCAGDVKDTLRSRMNNARWARTGGSVLQVITAAVSSLLTGIAGRGAIEAATVLSGTSAIIPDVSQIIGARERAEAYSEGVKSVEEAEALYLQAIAEMENGRINDANLTPAGAALYTSMIGAIHLVEARLTGQLPTIQDLRKAKPTPVILSGHTATNLKAGASPLAVRVIGGGPVVSAVSSDLSIADVTSEESGMTVTIVGKAAGEAVITVKNESGGWATIKVQVQE